MTHHSLETLLIDSSVAVRSAMMQTLVLPELRNLSTNCYGFPIDLSCCGVIAQQNNFPELRVIAISGDVPVRWSNTNPVPSLRAHMPFLGPAIQNLANLRVLTFRHINFEGGRWLPDLGNSCPHLRWLLFIKCTGYTIASIRSLVETRILRDGINPLEILSIEPHSTEAWESRLQEGDADWFRECLTLMYEDDCWYI
ncbi:hypothetical protein FRC01_012810 [Tulasnella sp. 417]|nr:hypothetical protein FRC01_012810 [Tulasnella sp. 417]